jgi:transposase
VLTDASLNCTPIVRHNLTIGGAFLLAKFTAAEKIIAVKRYLEGHTGYQTLAQEIGVHVSKLQYWVKKYQYHGEAAFLKTYTNYTPEYKLDVINYMNEHGTSIIETAARFNLSSESILWKWQNTLSTQGWMALEPKERGRPTMKKDLQKPTNKTAPTEGSVEALQAELEFLRMENAYLKKLNALVQSKGKSPKNPKLE